MSLRERIGKVPSCSWSDYLDCDAQGHGYGRAAALAVRILQTADADMPIRLSAEETHTKAHRLYGSPGSRLTDERDGDDLVFALSAANDARRASMKEDHL